MPTPIASRPRRGARGRPRLFAGRLRLLVRLLPLLACLPPLAASAQYTFEKADDFDHRGMWSVEAAPVLLWISSTTDGRNVTGGALGVDAAVSRALEDEGDELSLHVRAVVTGPVSAVMLLGGYRAYFGRSAWKTFADLQLLVPIVPGPSAGARVGLGLMYDAGRNVGISVSGAAYAAAGFSFVTGFDAQAALQIRF